MNIFNLRDKSTLLSFFIIATLEIVVLVRNFHTLKLDLFHIFVFTKTFCSFLHNSLNFSPKFVHIYLLFLFTPSFLALFWRVSALQNVYKSLYVNNNCSNSWSAPQITDISAKTSSISSGLIRILYAAEMSVINKQEWQIGDALLLRELLGDINSEAVRFLLEYGVGWQRTQTGREKYST